MNLLILKFSCFETGEREDTIILQKNGSLLLFTRC